MNYCCVSLRLKTCFKRCSSAGKRVTPAIATLRRLGSGTVGSAKNLAGAVAAAR